MSLSENELREIEARSEAATSSPWKSFVEGRNHTSGSSFIMTGGAFNRRPDIELTGATTADQDFIASARQDIPKLLEEIRLLRELLLNTGIVIEPRTERTERFEKVIEDWSKDGGTNSSK